MLIHFKNIENFNYKTNYISNLVSLSKEYKEFRIAYIDENSQANNGTLLFIHGHPTWSYLWRHLIPIALKQDYRVLAIDLPGFGKSDKPLKKDFFTFKNFNDTNFNRLSLRRPVQGVIDLSPGSAGRRLAEGKFTFRAKGGYIDLRRKAS